MTEGRKTPTGIERMQGQIRSAGWSISEFRRGLRRFFWGAVIADVSLLVIGFVSLAIRFGPGVMALLLFALLFLCLIIAFPFLFPIPVIQRQVLRRQLRRQLEDLSRADVEAVLLPLRNDPLPDTRKLAAPLIARFCPDAPTEVVPSGSPIGSGHELGVAVEDQVDCRRVPHGMEERKRGGKDDF